MLFIYVGYYLRFDFTLITIITRYRFDKFIEEIVGKFDCGYLCNGSLLFYFYRGCAKLVHKQILLAVLKLLEQLEVIESHYEANTRIFALMDKLIVGYIQNKCTHKEKNANRQM